LIYLFKKSGRWPATRAELYYRWIKYETLVEYYQNFNRRVPTIRSDTDLDKLFSSAPPFYRDADENSFTLAELFEGPVPGATATDEQVDYAILSFLPALAYHQIRDRDFFASFRNAVKNNPLLERFIQTEFTEELHQNCRISSEHYIDYFVALHCANLYMQRLPYFLPEGETIELFFDEILNANRMPEVEEELE
jgi:hypothetical protein